mmetsp:Transcript_59/g.202  ORF Transcript_59/g.202 Transcript_59/m.202 type:complete len:210 (+) Transcript_59:2323-2952(+)
MPRAEGPASQCSSRDRSLQTSLQRSAPCSQGTTAPQAAAAPAAEAVARQCGWRCWSFWRDTWLSPPRSAAISLAVATVATTPSLSIPRCSGSSRTCCDVVVLGRQLPKMIRLALPPRQRADQFVAQLPGCSTCFYYGRDRPSSWALRLYTRRLSKHCAPCSPSSFRSLRAILLPLRPQLRRPCRAKSPRSGRFLAGRGRTAPGRQPSRA